MCIAKVFKLFLLRNSNKKFDVKKVDKILNKCKFPYSNMFCYEPNRGWIKSIKSSSTLVQWDEKQMKAFIGCQQQHSRVQMKRGENRVVKPNVQLQNLLNANLGFKIHLFRYLSEIALNLRAWRRGKKLDELFITATFASVFMALMAFLFVHCGEMQSKVFFHSTFLFSKSPFYRLNFLSIHTYIRSFRGIGMNFIYM